LKDKFIGLVIGVLIVVVPQAINEYSPLFRSRIRIPIDSAPKLALLGEEIEDRYVKLLFEAVQCVKNSGFRAGRLTRISFSPSSLKVVPKIEVVSFYQGEIKGFEERVIRTKFIVYMKIEDRAKEHQVRLDFFDENDYYVGGLKLYREFRRET